MSTLLSAECWGYKDVCKQIPVFCNSGDTDIDLWTRTQERKERMGYTERKKVKKKNLDSEFSFIPE